MASPSSMAAGGAQIVPATPSFAGKFNLYRRPGFGKCGMPISLLANHYRVRFQNKELFHYDVTIEPRPPKGFNYKIIYEAFKKYPEAVNNAVPAYDGHKSLYTAKPLSDKQVELDVVLAEGEGGGASSTRRVRTYHVLFRQAATINLRQLAQYIAGEPVSLPQEALQVMDVVLRQAALRFFVEKGRSFFGKHFGVEKLQGGLVAYRGFYQSIRPAQEQLLTLNIDIAAAPFYDSVDLPTFIGEAFRKDPRDLDREFSRHDSVGDGLRSRLKRLLKGLRVETTHIRHSYRVKGLTDRPLEVLSFDSNGVELSVVDYFQQQYKLTLRLRGFPAIEAGNNEKKRYVPIELCRIQMDQPYIKALTEQQRSGLLTLTCLHPQDRRERTKVIGEQLRDSTAKDAAEFGIQINTLMTEVPGRVLPPPKILYKAYEENPREGAWNMRGKVIWRGAKISSWAVINFSKFVPPQAVQNFANRLPELCKTYGVLMNPNLAAPPATEINGNVEGVVKHMIESAEKNGNPLELILCIMPQQDNKHLYATVKRLCELEFGVWTQCCLADHVKKCKPEYIANVILKINAKLGGQNSLLVDEQKKQLPLISDVPSLIIGADISHSRVGEDGPSISSFVASMDWPCFSKYESVVRTQKRGSEIFDDLYWEKEDEQGRKQTGGIFKELLSLFQERCNMKPERILYYRDGVSDGQFEMVLNNELGALKKTFEALGWTDQSQTSQAEEPSQKRPRTGKSPKVTFIVVQKRHHTRFFPNTEKRCPTLRNGNLQPGTVVDSTICQPKIFDFYLCSHAGIKGTSKPAHYNVLQDENGFTADDIQRLTNDLCFTYARCTRSVSIVPACYYAHLAAKRARVWLDSGSNSESGSFHGRSVSGISTGSGSQVLSGPFMKPLPPVHGRIKNSMFFI